MVGEANFTGYKHGAQRLQIQASPGLSRVISQERKAARIPEQARRTESLDEVKIFVHSIGRHLECIK